MTTRIEVKSKVEDARAKLRQRKLSRSGFRVDGVEVVDVYTIDASLNQTQLDGVVRAVVNPVVQEAFVDFAHVPERFDYAIEIGFLPGVTDNIGNTVREQLVSLGVKPNGQTAYSSQVLFVSGDLNLEEVASIGNSLANPLIQRVSVKSQKDFLSNKGMGVHVPKVHLNSLVSADIVDILGVTDEELARIGKQGIADLDGSRRGPLALDLAYMKTIQAYFKSRGHNPTDVELESIAQTWSEHCKHTIFADPVLDKNSGIKIERGLFKTFIKGATERIRKNKGNLDFCVSVFTDNSGAIEFDETHLITHKVETHNSPSALDPFGGAITGIVGVNRDALGFGLGAKPVVNTYGFCVGNPSDNRPLFKGANKSQKMLSPRRILEGIVEGVNSGGNCSGIPTPQGFVSFDERYRGKPLVFVGTVGLIPRVSAGRLSHEKGAQNGDFIVMIGGRVGKDGIHGATFSSEAIDSGSPATAVQIGDPITQKKLSDVVIQEARDLGLYTSITDNGAGGLSCSIAEMAKESNGCVVRLENVPTKYHGLKPWEIWISESQERMTLSVPRDKWDEFSALMKRRGVEASVIGQFTNSGNCTVTYGNSTVMDIDLSFLHDGLPVRVLEASYKRPVHAEPIVPVLDDLTETIHAMLSRLNVCSFEFISRQYDHEVQGGSVLKPLQGRGRVNADATVTRPVLSSKKGVVLSQGVNPSYSDIDTYQMAACAIDTAVRNAVVAGASLDRIALLDNFCWCSSNEEERLGQLVSAGRACYDTAVAYNAPFISGKDSMFNDFKGFDENGNPVKISVPPTLLVSSIAVLDDVSKAVSLDAKCSGDLVYVLGETSDEIGGSEYLSMVGEQRGERLIGNSVPCVDFERNKRLYFALENCISEGVVASAQSVHRGGLAVALAKTAIGGGLGMTVDFSQLPGSVSRDDYALFSESMGRVVVTVAQNDSVRFEKLLADNAFYCVGMVTVEPDFVIAGSKGKVLVNTDVRKMVESYRKTLGDL